MRKARRYLLDGPLAQPKNEDGRIIARDYLGRNALPGPMFLGWTARNVVVFVVVVFWGVVVRCGGQIVLSRILRYAFLDFWHARFVNMAQAHPRWQEQPSGSDQKYQKTNHAGASKQRSSTRWITAFETVVNRKSAILGNQPRNDGLQSTPFLLFVVLPKSQPLARVGVFHQPEARARNSYTNPKRERGPRAKRENRFRRCF